jgi:hypothetical protein
MVNVKGYSTGNFLRPEDAKGKTATITGEGFLNTDTPFDREILEIPIKLEDNTELTYGMNKTSSGNLMEAWGEDTKSWVGKKIRFEVLKQNVRGAMKDIIYAYPLAEDKPDPRVVEEKQF